MFCFVLLPQCGVCGVYGVHYESMKAVFTMKGVVRRLVASGRQNSLVCCCSVMLNHEKNFQAVSGRVAARTASTMKEGVRQ